MTAPNRQLKAKKTQEIRENSAGDGSLHPSIPRQLHVFLIAAFVPVPPHERGLQPNTAYRYQVCAHFITTDGDVECADWTQPVRTTAAETPPKKPGAPPTPRIVEHHAGDTWIGVKWEAGFNYHEYHVNINEVAAAGEWVKPTRTISHNDDGTWGYQRVDGLEPGRTYALEVQSSPDSHPETTSIHD
jgi:hypothetical protein